MRYLLDANVVIGLLKGSPKLSRKLRQHPQADVGIPVVVTHELFYGAYRSRQIQQNIARVESLRFEVVEFDKEDARQAGEIRAGLAATGTPIGPYDVLIAGQAKARRLTLITHNVAEFSRVAGLQVEDWEA